jgi:hypothetical protein
MHNELSSLQSKLIESFKTSLVDTIKDELEGVIDERISSANSLSLQQQQVPINSYTERRERKRERGRERERICSLFCTLNDIPVGTHAPVNPRQTI